MNVTETLQAARDLIADPAHWTVHALARDSRGKPMFPIPTDPREPVQFCALGAICRIMAAPNWNFSFDPSVKFLGEVAKEQHPDLAARLATSPAADWVATVNNERGHEATIAMFDKAILRSMDL